MQLSSAVAANNHQDLAAREHAVAQRHSGCTTGQETTAGGRVGTGLMVRPTVSATGGAGNICDGAPGVHNDGELLGRCAKVQSGIEVSAGDAGGTCLATV